MAGIVAVTAMRDNPIQPFEAAETSSRSEKSHVQTPGRDPGGESALVMNKLEVLSGPMALTALGIVSYAKKVFPDRRLCQIRAMTA